MSNCCFYSLMANGSKESISRLKDIMSGKDSIHLWRVYKDDVSFDLSEDGKTLSANGDCAWSVSSSFNKCYIPEGSNALTIREISEKLGLTIEIWADEEGNEIYTIGMKLAEYYSHVKVLGKKHNCCFVVVR